MIKRLIFILALFLLAISNIYFDCEDIFADDVVVVPFEVLHDGDIIYDGSDEPIVLHTTISDDDDISYFTQLKVNDDYLFYYEIDYYTKDLIIRPESLKTLRKGTSTLTLILYYGDDTKSNYYSSSFDITSTVLTRENADIIINDKYHQVLYSKDEQSNTDIDGLKVIKPGIDSDTYIFKLEKDVELTGYNEECIISQFGCSIQIIGPYTLTIIWDHDTEYHYAPAIRTNKDFILGDKTANYTTNLVINDPFVLNNKDRNTLLGTYSFGVWCQNQIKIYNSKITVNITSDLLISYEGAEILNSTIEHNAFANFTIPESSYCYSTTIRNDNGLFLIDNSTIKTKVIPSESYANVPMECICSLTNDFGEETSSYLHINNSIIDFEPIPLHTDDCLSYLIDSNTKILVENSNISTKNTTYGIFSFDSTEIKNSDIQINSNSGSIASANTLTLTYNDNKDHVFNLTTKDQEEIDCETHFPSIYIFIYNEEEGKLDPAPTESLVVNLPENAELSSNGEKIKIEDLFKYKTISFTTDKKEPDNPEQKEEHSNNKDNNRNYIIPKTGIK